MVSTRKSLLSLAVVNSGYGVVFHLGRGLDVAESRVFWVNWPKWLFCRQRTEEAQKEEHRQGQEGQYTREEVVKEEKDTEADRVPAKIKLLIQMAEAKQTVQNALRGWTTG